MKNFWVRAASAVVYVALFLFCIYSGDLTGNKLLGGVILAAFLLFVACGCTFEFFRIVKQQGATPSQPLGYAFTVIALLALSAVAYGKVWGYVGLGVAVTLLPMAFGVAAMVQLWKHSEQPFRDAAYTMVPMLYAAIPLGLMPSLHESYNALVMVLIMVWMNDNGAYMGGSLLGKHKMWERHSPNKTWEGTIGGALFCIAAAILAGPHFDADTHVAGWAVIGLICSVAGTLGDLVESMFKRYCGVKDSGKIMPGHGGVLDRFDSILMTVPFVMLIIGILNM